MNKMLSTCVQNICRSYTQQVAGPRFRGEENKDGRTVSLELGSEQAIRPNESY
jgi:protein-tyrosine-phosphatase